MSSQNTQPITLGEVIEQAPDSWIYGTITAQVVRSEMKQGRSGPFAILEICDPDTNTRIDVSLFGFARRRLPEPGAFIQLSGSLKRDEYNGKPKVKSSGQFELNTFLASPIAQQQHPAPAQRTPPAQAQGKAPMPLPGVSVGNTLKIVTGWAQSLFEQGNMALGTPECHRWIYEQASHLLRTQAVLEKGKIASNSDEWLEAMRKPVDNQEEENQDFSEPVPAVPAIQPNARIPERQPRATYSAPAGAPIDEDDIAF